MLFRSKPDDTTERREFYRRLSKNGAAPLWEVLADLVPVEPRPACVPNLWRYDELRPLLMEAGGLITAKEAERRVLMLENPGMPGSSLITHSLYAGLQLVMPGEITPTHRHTAAALRFILEGNGAYTAVDGVRIVMHPGDFILTPSWTYHDHGNPSSEPIVWLDGLDIPMVNMFSTGFAEHHPDETQAVVRTEGGLETRHSLNLLPVENASPGQNAPVFAYPYSRSREALERSLGDAPLDPCHGMKMRYVNPATGGYPFPTIGAFLQLLPKGFNGSPYRSTDATVF